VLLLHDRRTGVLQAIGANGARGRAVARVQQPPFNFPATAVEGDVAAFLESEAVGPTISTRRAVPAAT
jgi:hypothetical protein